MSCDYLIIINTIFLEVMSLSSMYINTCEHICAHNYVIYGCIDPLYFGIDSFTGVWPVWLWQDSYTEGVHSSNVTTSAICQNVDLYPF